MKGLKHFAILMIMILAVGAGFEGCKSSGKMSKKERKAQIEIAKGVLKSIISGTTTLSLSQQEREVNNIINKKLNDPEVNELVIQAQQAIKQAYADKARLHSQQVDAAKAELLDMLLNKDNKSPAELQKQLDMIKSQNLNDQEVNDLVYKVQNKIDVMNKPKAELPIKTQLENSFQAIADAARNGNGKGADDIIKNTLQYFTSPDANVLIIIYRQGNDIDYDKPTTILRYLNFIKDQKSNPNQVDAIIQDATGKIKELDLIKK